MSKILKYDSVRMSVLHFIAENHLHPGDRLPPERQLVQQVNGSMITLRRALLELEYDGIIERRSGGRNTGTFLKRNLNGEKWDFTVLYINICRDGTGNDRASENYLGDIISYFNKRGIGVKYLNVSTIENDIILKSHNAAGILLDGWFDDKIAAQLSDLHLPLVLIGNRNITAKEKYPAIQDDVKKAAYLAFQQCAADGRKRIALLRGKDNYWAYDEYEAGCREAAAQCGLEPVIACAAPEQGLRQFLEEFMPEHTDIDGWIMPHSMFDRVISWYWRHQVTQQPEFIFLDHAPLFNDIVESASMRWITFESRGLAAASALLDSLLNHQKPQSRLLMPRFAKGADFRPLSNPIPQEHKG